MKKIFLMATVCALFVSCNSSVVERGGVRDSMAVAGDVVAKWDTIDWDERSMPIYVGVERVWREVCAFG